MAQGQTATQRKLEAKAINAASKSAGMRSLYEAGYTVAQVTKVMDVGYPFAYGVAKRGGFADTAATRRVIKAKATAKAPVSRKVTKVAKAATAKAAPALSAAQKRAALATKKPGRPTAARRQANRKTSAAAK